VPLIPADELDRIARHFAYRPILSFDDASAWLTSRISD